MKMRFELLLTLALMGLFAGVGRAQSGPSGGPEETANTFVTVFTPNGDGVNDLFHPAPGLLSRFTIKVYDRWGRMVYRGNENSLWDGKAQGSAAQSGVYIYALTGETPSGQRIERTSSLTLLR